jgi:hypothetical protein
VKTSQKDFFISYNSADAQWGTWIAEQLEKAGYTTIIQAWDFLAGENFAIGMQDAVTNTKQTIAVLSDNYFRANFTQPEWAAAFVQDPTGKKRKLIPVRVRPCQPAGMFAPIIYIDLVEKEEDIARQLLLTGVAPNGPVRRGPTTFPGKSSASAVGGSGAAVSVASSSLNPKPTRYPKSMPPVNKTVEVFIIHSRADYAYLVEIEKQLAYLNQKGLIKTWNSNQILPGSVIKREFKAHWEKAQIILLLVSVDLNVDASQEIQLAIQGAFDRHEEGSAQVIPILLRPCLNDFEERFAVLPLNKKPISSWSNKQDAYFEIATGIGQAAKNILFQHS